MSTKRAPNCPALSLSDAIEKLEKIYVIEGKNSFKGEVAVKHMDYNGLNGASRRALGALRSYGLIQGKGDELRISEDGVVVIADSLSADQSERQDCLLRALTHNRVFSDLHDQFGQGSSIISLCAYLQKKYGFKTGSAKKTARYYKDSAVLIDWSRHNEPGQNSEPESANQAIVQPDIVQSTLVQPSLAQPALKQFPIKNAAQPDSVPESPVTHEVRVDYFTLDKGNASLHWPGQLSAAEFEDFTDWLLVMHRKIGRKVDGGTRLKLKKKSAFDS